LNRENTESFRHSGAIEIFERTSATTKLQKAMGHSFINVTLTYLRGLELLDLKKEDMPVVFLKLPLLKTF
jgi:integrase